MTIQVTVEGKVSIGETLTKMNGSNETAIVKRIVGPAPSRFTRGRHFDKIEHKLTVVEIEVN